MSGRGIISVENPQQCDECGSMKELRPYGPGGKVVCFDCLTSHPEWKEEAERRMSNHLFGTSL